MKANLLILIRLFAPWLLLNQVAGLFTYISTSSVIAGALAMTFCTTLLGVLIAILPNRTAYYLYNLRQSGTAAYSLTSLFNLVVFLCITTFLKYTVYA